MIFLNYWHMIRTSELENLKLAYGKVTRSTPERILSSNSHLERNAIGNGCYLELFREFQTKTQFMHEHLMFFK